MKKVSKKFVNVLLVVGVLLAGFSVVPSVSSADDWFSCRATEVVEFSDRIHVRCSNSIVENGNTVWWLAIAKTDTTKAARFVSLGSSAVLSGKWFRVIVPTSSATNCSGCNASDCRTPTTFGVMN